jgi:CheY-like chemotaxis protein
MDSDRRRDPVQVNESSPVPRMPRCSNAALVAKPKYSSRSVNPVVPSGWRHHIGDAASVAHPRTKVSRVNDVPIISIVDDDASVRIATARLLRALGFSAHAFASAKEFLASPRFKETACLIADIQMPGMSGVELQEYLIAHGHRTPIIFITAFPEDQIRQQAMNSGAIGFLSKPFDETRLLQCVEQALLKRQSGDGTS